MDHQKIDRNTWARGELFAFYIDRMRVVMSLTVDIDAAPVVTWGRMEAEGEKRMMPLTMNIHHAVADGFHLSRFFTEVQEQIDALGAGGAPWTR